MNLISASEALGLTFEQREFLKVMEDIDNLIRKSALLGYMETTYTHDLKEKPQYVNTIVKSLTGKGYEVLTSSYSKSDGDSSKFFCDININWKNARLFVAPSLEDLPFSVSIPQPRP